MMKAGHATSAIVGDRASYEAAFAVRREVAPSAEGEEAEEGAPALAYDVGEFSRERALAEFSTDHLGVRPIGAKSGATRRIRPADNRGAAVDSLSVIRTCTSQTCRASTR